MIMKCKYKYLRKISRLESDVKKSISSEKFETTVAELNSRLSESEEKLNLEKYGRSQDKIQMERKIKNLQGESSRLRILK